MPGPSPPQRCPREPRTSSGTLTPLQEVCNVFLPLQGGLGALGEEAEQQVEQRLHAQTSGLLLLQQQLLQPLQTDLSRHPGCGEVSHRPRSHTPRTVREEDGAQAPLPGESCRAQPANYAASALAPGNIPDILSELSFPVRSPATVASSPRLSASSPRLSVLRIGF